MKILLGSFSALLALTALNLPAQAAYSDPGTTTKVAQEESDWETLVGGRPGPATPDRFHPDNEVPYEQKDGGRVIVHVSSYPKHMNYMTENSATTRRILREVHETLIGRNWETWEFEPVVSESWVEEDTLVLSGGRGEDNSNIYFGKITEEGDEYVITPISMGNTLKEVKRVKKAEGMELQRGNVFTFKLRDNVFWHDGKELDAHDVTFSHSLYKNMEVDCEAARFKFKKGFCDAIDDRNVRVFYDQQYFLSKASFEDLTILPSHVYNLKDPENENKNLEATDQEQGDFVNEHPNNRMFIGVGPYKIVEYNDEFIEAVKFDKYFNPSDGGHVDTIRWRHIASDDTTKQAVINGDIDFWERLRTEDYFGAYVEEPAFKKSFYKGLASMHYASYTTWNCRRPLLSNPNIRRALAHAFDWDSYIRTVYNGLAARMTSVMYYFGPSNDRTLEPIPFDPEAAEDLLLEEGWYDRDGDGIIDKDGNKFTLEWLMPTGNKASETFAQTFQEQLSKIGVELVISTREWATFLERLNDRDYDCANLAWITSIESDPEQIWMSYQADVPRSSNHSGFKSERVDEIIKQIKKELDTEARNELFHQMQREIHELQPYMFGLNQPVKFVMSKRIRNLKRYGIDPGYRIREWYIVGDEASQSEAAGTK